MAVVNFLPRRFDGEIQSFQWMSLLPSTVINSQTPVEFIINNAGYEFIDLSKLYLYTKLSITKKDGSPVTKEDKVALVNLPLQSMWYQVDVFWQNRLVSSSGLTYPYKAMFDVLLNYSELAKQTQLQSQLYYKDDAVAMEAVDPEGNPYNDGLWSRWLYTMNGQAVDMEGPLYVDVFQQEYLLVNGVAMKIKLTPSSDQFRLISSNDNYKLKLEEIKLKVCYVDIHPTVYSHIITRLDKETVKYHYMRSDIYTHSIQKGENRVILSNVYQDKVPSQLIIALVNSDSYLGKINSNPFNFKNFNVNYIDVNVNGKSIPYQQPLEPKHGTEVDDKERNALLASSYLTLFNGSGKLQKDAGNNINRFDFGHGYTMYCFSLDPAFFRGSQHPVTVGGNLRIEIRFNSALTENATLFMYGNFPQTIEVDKTRNVYII
jgi:hypothetical protein